VLPNISVVYTINYTKAKQTLETRSYKLMFIDLNMPDSNGSLT